MPTATEAAFPHADGDCGVPPPPSTATAASLPHPDADCGVSCAPPSYNDGALAPSHLNRRRLKKIDIITAGMGNALATDGGFCTGSVRVVDHQAGSDLM
ncbi:unnamed protein product [Miscanthus lutarioriparius]|uniref:Uncharacterized protein n=1 Tax=Miscanthus lutarioriparius TaxID=422564 RepID=A0A811M741_9POAL|nr:unnamed protein product [Miscanthus lutarioriparius]